jgi:Zn-dependent alcohol dehydrogenase
VIAEMTNGGVDRSVECTGSINAMISAFECVHDVIFDEFFSVIESQKENHRVNMLNILDVLLALQGWGVAVLVGVPNKDDSFKTHPMSFLNEKTLKGTFFGNYKPRSDLPSVVEMYMNKVYLSSH